jgi:hypothetical protein
MSNREWNEDQSKGERLDVAADIRAEERERCAKICESVAESSACLISLAETPASEARDLIERAWMARHCARMIRAVEP